MKQTLFDRFPQLKNIPEERFPKHIFIIPDGNGRWAQERNKFVTFGHKKGYHVVEKLLEDLGELKAVKVITVWGFAADNWKRSKKEIDGLMLIFTHMLKNELKKLQKRNGRFIHIGRRDRLPLNLIRAIEKAEYETRNNTGQIVCVAIDFGGEDQNLRMIEKVRQLPTDVLLSQEVIWKLRDGEGVIPPADLLIRTSGEIRTSDVGWLNGAPTELYFEEKLFPEVTTEDIVNAIVDFSHRERRLGGRK